MTLPAAIAAVVCKSKTVINPLKKREKIVDKKAGVH
jgi:hypothetical protein